MACLLRVLPLLFLTWSPHCKRLTPYSSTGYSFQNDVQRVIIHANDITMFVLCSHNSQGSSGTVGERTSPAYPWNCSTSRTLTDVSALETSDEDQHTVITADVLDQAQDLLTSGYTNKADDLKNQAWKNCEYKFLNKSALLKVLPSTEDTLLHHFKCAVLATAIDKSTHIDRPQITPIWIIWVENEVRRSGPCGMF